MSVRTNGGINKSILNLYKNRLIKNFKRYTVDCVQSFKIPTHVHLQDTYRLFRGLIYSFKNSLRLLAHSDNSFKEQKLISDFIVHV